MIKKDNKICKEETERPGKLQACSPARVGTDGWGGQGDAGADFGDGIKVDHPTAAIPGGFWAAGIGMGHTPHPLWQWHSWIWEIPLPKSRFEG